MWRVSRGAVICIYSTLLEQHCPPSQHGSRNNTLFERYCLVPKQGYMTMTHKTSGLGGQGVCRGRCSQPTNQGAPALQPWFLIGCINNKVALNCATLPRWVWNGRYVLVGQTANHWNLQHPIIVSKRGSGRWYFMVWRTPCPHCLDPVRWNNPTSHI